MIIESLILKNIIELVIHKINKYSPILEITSTYDKITFAGNYGDNYYIDYVQPNSSLENNEYIILLNYETCQKLHQIATFWPKSTLKIEDNQVEIINHGALIRERPVIIDCIFEKVDREYVITPPDMNYNCVINAKNLKQMLEFCYDNKPPIILETKNQDNLVITNGTKSIATMVQLEELKVPSSKPILLLEDATQLIISFLNKLNHKHNLVYFMFMEHQNAFSIQVNLDDNIKIQIYTIHD
jgi:hypothetical protein